MSVFRTLRGVGLAARPVVGVLGVVVGFCCVGVTGAWGAVTPGWECVPTTAGQAVTSGGTGASPSCGTESTAVLAPTYVASGVGGKPTVELSTVNLQVVNGLGSETTINGTGNLILGYDESSKAQSGSHNLVLGGVENSYSSYGGIVGGGFSNKISGPYASVLDGAENTSSGFASAIIGGHSNTVTANYSTISGGCSNLAGSGTQTVNSGCTTAHPGDFASITGGAGNVASGENSTVLGGTNGEASGIDASVTGGSHGKATYRASTVLGELGEVTREEFEVTP